MKKVQLKNKSSINKGSVSGPMGDEMTLNERGLLDDNSGSVEESFHGYGYSEVGVNSIIVRYRITWIRTQESYSGNITLDDESGQDYSGMILDDPIRNTDPSSYEFVSQSIDDVGTEGDGMLKGTWTIYYRDLRNIKPDEVPPIRFASGTINYAVPSWDELIQPNNNNS